MLARFFGFLAYTSERVGDQSVGMLLLAAADCVAAIVFLNRWAAKPKTIPDEIPIIPNLHPDQAEKVYRDIVGFLARFGHKYG